MKEENKLNPKTEFQKNAADIKEYEDFINKAVEQAKKQYALEKPEIAAKFKYKNAGHAFLPNNVPYKAMTPILDRMLQLKCADRPKAEILRKVIESNLEFKDKLNHNVWTKTIKPFQLTKLQVRVDGSMSNPIKLKGCKTLNDIRKMLIAEGITKDAKFKKKVNVTIDAKYVLIGKKQYTITNRKAKDREYPSIRLESDLGRNWIRVDLLEKLLS